LNWYSDTASGHTSFPYGSRSRSPRSPVASVWLRKAPGGSWISMIAGLAVVTPGNASGPGASRSGAAGRICEGRLRSRPPGRLEAYWT